LAVRQWHAVSCRLMAIIAGASGYDYPEWVGEGLFYPASLAHNRQDWLTYYASQFRLLELNFTYYGETTAQQMEQMLKRVQPARRLWLLEGDFAPRNDFEFVIKAYASLTHVVDTDWRTQAQKFKVDTAPLSQSGKLLGVLAQFPSRAHYGAELMGYVTALAETLAPLQLIAEFRHAPWYRYETRQALAAAGIVVAGVDAPQEAKLPVVLGGSAQDAGEEYDLRQAKADGLFSYVRMHGRREGFWWSGDAGSRYEYSYSENQLERLARKLIEADSNNVYIAFNNHRYAEAPRNAVKLQAILERLLSNLHA
jgi:uncharacterized protein YecE (DUF72 family)